MHERVGGAGGPGVGSRGAQSSDFPGPAAGEGGRAGAPGPAPGPSLQSSGCACSGGGVSGRGPAWCGAPRGGEQAARPGPRCQGAGRGAGLQRPGAPLLRDRSRGCSPSGHCYEAAGLWWERNVRLQVVPWPALSVPLGRFGLRLPAGLRLGAGLGPRGASEAKNALRPRPGVEVTLQAQIGGPSGG